MPAAMTIMPIPFGPMFRAAIRVALLLCIEAVPAWAETTAAGSAAAVVTTEENTAAVEADLTAAREKLAAGPERSLLTMLAEGIATEEEAQEWTLLLNLRIAGLEKHLDALRSLAFEVQSHQEVKAQVEAWSGFPEPPPYSIDFIDDLWSDLIAGEQDVEAVRIERNLLSTQLEVLRNDLNAQQQSARQAAEHAMRSSRAATPAHARLDWLSELAAERTLTTLTTLAQYEAELRRNDETLAILALKLDLLQRQIAAATAMSPLTQAEFDAKLAQNRAKRVALQEELTAAVGIEQKAQDKVQAARADLLELQSQTTARTAKVQADIAFAQAMLDARKAQAETAILRQESLRLLLDATRGAERIWRARFEVARGPGVARLREMRAMLTDVSERIELWRQYLDNSLEAATGLTAAAEKRLLRSTPGSPEHTIAEAMIEAFQERKALYQRMQAEISDVRLLLQRWEQEVLAQDRKISRMERLRDFAHRLADLAVTIWNFEVFSVKETIEVEGREITGSSSVTVGKITTVVLILTLGLWIAAVASSRLSLLLRQRFDMNKTAATLLERGVYIVAVVALILTALDIVNIPLTVFAFLGGALAIGIGFGAQNLINNFISGLILLVERPISLGDLVEVEGVRGRVGNIGARCSRIHRADGIDMLVPNSTFLEKNVTNLTLTDTRLRVAIKLGVAYGSPLRDVTRLLKEAAANHGKVLKEPEPLILFEDFGDDALKFAMEFWVNVSPQTDFRVVASDLRYMLERVLREAGIEIAYPQRDVHLDQRRPLEVVVAPRGAWPEPAGD